MKTDVEQSNAFMVPMVLTILWGIKVANSCKSINLIFAADQVLLTLFLFTVQEYVVEQNINIKAYTVMRAASLFSRLTFLLFKWQLSGLFRANQPYYR